MSRRDTAMAALATLLVAANLLALTVASPQHHPGQANAGSSRTRARARKRAGTLEARERQSPAAPPQQRAPGKARVVADRSRIAAPEAALRQAARFARVYAYYRDHRLDSRGVTELRRSASLQLAQTLIDQPSQLAGGQTRPSTLGGRPRVRVAGGRATVVDVAVNGPPGQQSLRCTLLSRRGAWVVTGFSFGSSTVGLALGHGS